MVLTFLNAAKVRDARVNLGTESDDGHDGFDQYVDEEEKGKVVVAVVSPSSSPTLFIRIVAKTRTIATTPSANRTTREVVAIPRHVVSFSQRYTVITPLFSN